MTVYEIAQKRELDQIERREEWNGYRVYTLYKKGVRWGVVGLPHFVLEKGGVAREATAEEAHRILSDRGANRTS